MKNLLIGLSGFVFIVFFSSHCATAQDTPAGEIQFEVNTVYPPLSIKKDQLLAAHTLADLNKHFKPAWVRAYQSVEITTTHKGTAHITPGINETLTQAQKEKLFSADPGSDIVVNVRYMPDNTMMQNTGKELQFAFTVNPEQEAQFVGSPSKLKQYILDQAINKIPPARFDASRMAAVKFTVSETGQVTEVHVAESSSDNEIDGILLKAINQMPRWQPAAFANGTRTSQEFVLTVGNMESCVQYLFNIRKD